MLHLCLFTSSVPFFMLPSRFVRSCSHDGAHDGDDGDGLDGEDGDDGDVDGGDDDENANHLNKKLLYEIFCHRVDVPRPVNLPAEDYHLKL